LSTVNPAIPIDKVCEAIRNIAAMGVWGTFTLNFEAGEITKITDGFVWKAGDVERNGGITGPSDAIKKTLPAIKKRMVIRAGAGT